MNDNNENLPQDLTFKFVRSPDVKVVPVTSFWLYPTDRGFLVDLCFDRPRPTLSAKFTVMKDGKLGPQSGSVVADEVMREVVASLEMSPEMAMAMGEYLIESAKKRTMPVEGSSGADKVH